MTFHSTQTPISLQKQRKSSWRPSLRKFAPPLDIRIQPTPYIHNTYTHFSQTSPTSTSNSNSNSNSNNNTTQEISPTPPPVAPYSLKTRHEKSFANQSCCFCEESLEIQLTNERVLALECSHVCHFGCLLLFAEKDPALFDNVNPDAAMPDCLLCNQKLSHLIIQSIKNFADK